MMKHKPLKMYARKMRFEMTPAEQALWYHLRNRRFMGLRFTRQVVIGDYIVDFLCKELKLVIEVDGGQHAENQEYDDKRTLFLEERGYRVIRFWNVEVLTEIAVVLEQIYETVGKLHLLYP